MSTFAHEAPKRLLVLMLVIGLAACSNTQPSPPSAAAMVAPLSAQDFSSNADAYLSKLTAEKFFSGSVLVAQNGEALVSKGYGEADREKNTPNTVQTRFRLGSITKQFTK